MSFLTLVFEHSKFILIDGKYLLIIANVLLPIIPVEPKILININYNELNRVNNIIEDIKLSNLSKKPP